MASARSLTFADENQISEVVLHALMIAMPASY
jgi:hypothetical protein